MKVKIFLGEYTYIYRGDIDLTEMNEFVKTLTNRAFVIKWKDQEGDLITITKKQDLAYFYQLWTENSATNKQSFRLFVHEIPQIIQNLQITQLQSQSQIYSKMFSPSQRQSISKQSGISQFTFGLQLNEQAKSVDIQKERHSQQTNLQSIIEVQGSSKNISNQNLDKVQQQYQWNEDGKKQRLGLDFNNIHAQDLSFFMNMDMKQSINRKEFTEIQLAVDDDYEDCDDFGNINYNDREKFDIANIYCDYCSDKIEEESTMLYTCQFCEDFHACQLCFDQYQEQVHVHQLQENILQ
ncbi:unnamed protein product (macronuclear) [Paramecium tetraurelia]|uniref:ZZ-type domain-containing protein n=1 Tax=Paramecium tetraurelia TaxID=5888 RepID=A0DJJ1_PARTE|nr:uncharacterized protein GSPATT00017552001 [Paramecium tetraurelia]CAK83208.1 unnamed protein product [Paramecium tetraurelia]|eukprot:XP_001450605.1 hypothetical protein (macronuclear) [Paramecium tetraurelia strain d4-2]